MEIGNVADSSLNVGGEHGGEHEVVREGGCVHVRGESKGIVETVGPRQELLLIVLLMLLMLKLMLLLRSRHEVVRNIGLEKGRQLRRRLGHTSTSSVAKAIVDTTS